MLMRRLANHCAIERSSRYVASRNPAVIARGTCWHEVPFHPPDTLHRTSVVPDLVSITGCASSSQNSKRRSLAVISSASPLS